MITLCFSATLTWYLNKGKNHSTENVRPPPYVRRCVAGISVSCEYVFSMNKPYRVQIVSVRCAIKQAMYKRRRLLIFTYCGHQFAHVCVLL